MPMGHFTGRILPSFLGFTFKDIKTIGLTHRQLGLKVAYTIVIHGSEVRVDCEVPHYDDEHLGYLQVRALDLVRACVDVAVFATGLGLSVILDTFTKPNGETVLLSFANQSLAQECTVFKMTDSPSEKEKDDFQKLMKAVLTEPALFLALNDLSQSLSGPHQVLTNCGRVLDGLRKIVAPGLEPRKGWPTLQAIVNVDESYMKWVSDQATNPRHGDRSFIEVKSSLKLRGERGRS